MGSIGCFSIQPTWCGVGRRGLQKQAFDDGQCVPLYTFYERLFSCWAWRDNPMAQVAIITARSSLGIGKECALLLLGACRGLMILVLPLPRNLMKKANAIPRA